MALLKIKTNKTLLPLSLAIALGALSTNSFALTVDVSTTYTVGSGTNVVTGSDAQSLDTATSTATSISTSAFDYSLDYTSSIATSVYGTTDGNFFARARGTGTFNASSTITYVDTIFNTTGTSQDYILDFNIIQGSINVYQNNLSTTASNFNSADYSVDIFLTNSSGATTSLFTSSAALFMDSTGSTTFSGDTILGGSQSSFPGDSAYTWADYAGSLSLGTFAADDSFTLSYGMTANASGSFTPSAQTYVPGITAPAPGSDIELCIECFEGEEGFVAENGSGSRTGDPFGVSGTPFISAITSTPTPTVSVPEASSMLLMALGLAGLAATRRRKSKLN